MVEVRILTVEVLVKRRLRVEKVSGHAGSFRLDVAEEVVVCRECFRYPMNTIV